MVDHKNFGEESRRYDTNRIEYELALQLMEGKSLGKKVLDVGAGRGEFADMLTKRGYDVACVEGAEELYSSLRDKGHKVAQVDLEEEQLPFPDNSFDLIVSLEVIEHLWETDHYLRELQRVVRPNGYVIITTPNYNYWTFRLHMALGHAERFLTQDYHKKLFTSHSLLKRVGKFFHIREVKGRGMVPKLHYHYPVPFWLNLWAMHIGVIAQPKKA